jgi:four helix bundle protein
MVAKTLEELLVYQKALEMWDAVNAILQVPRLMQDLRLHGQIRDASDSVLSNIAEGFEQPTDKAFAHYLYTSKASAAEVRTRLLIATKRKYIPEGVSAPAIDLADQVIKMCVGLARYLVKSNQKRRGLG